MKTNVLYYGDNLDILRHGYVDEESVDLIYLDPPFNSNATYNVIFKDESGEKSDAQIVAFDDTWHWGPDAETKYAYLTNSAYHQGRVPSTVSALVGAFHAGIHPSPMLAYLVEMAVRLVELHRVLKPTGSLWLHCDPTASSHLKLLLDAIFGSHRFLNEVIWKRSSAHSDTTQGAVHLGRTHDVLLFYSKGAQPTRNIVYAPFTQDYVDSHYGNVEAGTGRRYRKGDLTAAKPGGDTSYEWTGPSGKAVRPYTGRYWAYSKANMQEFEGQGRLVYTKSGMPEYKRYLDDNPGTPLQDMWDDIAPINSQAKERLPWATQKPQALLERIVALSSNPGDVVLDPFCGCGTALVAAQTLGRRWIGIDVTYLAIVVMRERLQDSFSVLGSVEVIGRPTEVTGARELLAKGGLAGQYQFQWWALDLIGATPQGGKKMGADKGVDGVISFTGSSWKAETCIVSVKSGGVNPGMVQALRGAMQSHGAVMGLFVTLEEPTPQMKVEAAQAGFYHSELSGKDYAAVQILTIRELLDEGKKPNLPLLVMPAYQKAQPVKKAAEQTEAFGSG